jgi:hypothetical protein
VHATWTPDETVLITDQANERVIEVNLDKKILFQYETSGVSGFGPNQLNNRPNSERAHPDRGREQQARDRSRPP